MFKRTLTRALQQKARSYPIVVVTGPRQSGKTTLVREVFAHKPYISLEDLDQRDFAIHDPRGFLAQFQKGAILDEIQRCPELLSYLQGIVDNQREMGLFILTGSQQLALMRNITQSLAGRAGLVQLLPFSLQELTSLLPSKTLEELMFEGFYPPIYDRPVNPKHWQLDYINTYLERDVRELLKVQDLRTFQLFTRLCAARTGQLLNLSSLATDCGVTHNTIKAWISILEASYIIFLLPPYHRNFNKRLIKSPKLYFYDTGLACALLNIQTPDALVTHSQRGALFETFVVSELYKQRFNQSEPAEFYFWRDSQGREVDLLWPDGEQLTALEIKSGHTITQEALKNLLEWQQLASSTTSSKAYLIYAGHEKQVRQGVHILPWRQLGQEWT